MGSLSISMIFIYTYVVEISILYNFSYTHFPKCNDVIANSFHFRDMYVHTYLQKSYRYYYCEFCIKLHPHHSVSAFLSRHYWFCRTLLLIYMVAAPHWVALVNWQCPSAVWNKCELQHRFADRFPNWCR
jgi:hypothetical protein